MVEVKADNKPWFYDIQQYLIKRVYPKNATKKEKAIIWWLALTFKSLWGVLYRRTSDGMQLKCLNEIEATKVMEEIHEGICGLHMNGAVLAKKLGL